MVQSLLQRELVDSSVERSLNDLLAQLPSNHHPRPISILDIKVPKTPWAEAVARWTKDVLTPGLHSHSRRSFFHASALLDPELGKCHDHRPGVNPSMPTQSYHRILSPRSSSKCKAAWFRREHVAGPNAPRCSTRPRSSGWPRKSIELRDSRGDPRSRIFIVSPTQLTSSTPYWGTSSRNRTTPSTPLPKYQIGEVSVLVVIPRC